MFEKIFGIFRKGKKSELSAEFPGDAEEDMFDLGDTGIDDDFDADTISLETGMSDGGFSDPSGGGIASDPEFADTYGDAESPVGLEEEPSEFAALEEPITPPPEVEPVAEEPYIPAKRKKGKTALLVVIVAVIAGLAVGFLLASPASIETMKRITSTEPTIQEQMEVLLVENAELDGKLKAYRSVGTVDEILAIKAELKKRQQMSAEMAMIESKVADRPAVEDRLDRTTAKLDQVNRALIIEQGKLANVQKSLKQIEARNNYLITSTRMHLDHLEAATVKSERLKARLDEERIRQAETAAMMPHDVQKAVEEAALEALSSL